MFKNVRFSLKIGSGFGVLLLLLGFVAVMGIAGLRQVRIHVVGMIATKDISISILEMRREEKNFIIRGGQDYVGKVLAGVKKISALVTALEASGLSTGELSNVSAARDGTKDYESAFASYVAARGKATELETLLSQTDERLLGALDSANKQLSDEYLRLRGTALYFLKDRSDDHLQAFGTSAAAFKSDLDRWTSSARSVSSAQGLQAIWAEYTRTFEDVHTLYQQQAQLDSTMVAAGRQVIDSASRIEAQLDAQTRNTLAFSVLSMLVSAAGALVLGVLLSVLLAAGIAKPLRRGVEFAAGVASGDFSRLLDINQRDEVGVLAQALNGMCVKLRDVISTIQESAAQVAVSSEQISASTQSTAEGAQSQASMLEETSVSMEELSASISQVSENAQSQSAAVEQSSSSLAQLQKSIDEISRSFDSISGLAAASVDNADEGTKAARQVVEGIALIAESSEKIGGIVNVISDIADQTNLLALNASIEAARAGELGRGFSVVADEVGKLADRSSTSTKEIGVLITQSMKNVTKGVEIATGSRTTMEHIRGASQEVKEMIAGLTESMRQHVSANTELAKALENLSEMSQAISAATEEQSANAKQVSKAVEGVNELTQAAAAAAEETSASTEQLSGMAQQLQGLTAGFKVEGNGNGNQSALLLSNVESGNSAQMAMSEEVAAAINAHSRWFFHLQDAIKTGKSEYRPETVAADNVCEFGKWLYGHLASKMGGTPIYATIKDLHARFHQQTSKILTLGLQGRTADAASLIAPDSEYRQLSGMLVLKLTELKKAARQTIAIADEITAAIEAHSRWFARLQDAVRTGRSEYRPETVAVDNACEFGKWLYGHLASQMGGTPIYEAIKDLHARFHQQTSRVLTLGVQGRKADASALIAPDSECRQLSGMLVSKLTELRGVA